jgi:uncharacterized iron-regulated membrane protein
MSQSLNARLRRLWLDVHLWIGVGLMLVLIPLALSGAILVWHDPLDRSLHAERYATSGPGEQPLDAYAAAAQGVFGSRAQLSQIRLPEKARDPVVAVGRMAGPPGPGGRPRSLNAWIDPATARVLGVGEPGREFSMTLHRLHGTLLIPDMGRKVVGWLGWAMFVSSATGLWLWWPRHGSFLKGLRWRRGASQLFNLHHTIGFWICLPLAALSLTGVIISFPQTAERVAGIQPSATAGGRSPDARARASAPPLAQPSTPLAAAVEAAHAHGAMRIRAVTWPQEGPRPVWRFDVAGGQRPTSIAVDDASGEVRKGRRGGDASGPPQRSAFLTWARHIHDGTDQGPVWQTIIVLAGIAPAVLGITGLIMWLRRRARRRALAAALA